MVLRMEHTWKLGGVYANWRLTITVEPPDEVLGPELPDRTLNYFGGVAHHFTEVVNLCESLNEARTL